MKKYAISGVVILLVFALFRWNGTQTNEYQLENAQEASTYVTTFSSKQHVLEKLQRLSLMQKAIKVPTYVSKSGDEVAFTAKVMAEHTSMTLHFTLDDAQEQALTVTSNFPRLATDDYKEVEWNGQVGWVRETKEEVEVVVENEGLYYRLVGLKEKEEELSNVLQTLQETDMNRSLPFEGMKLPTIFPGHLLVVDEVYYTNESNENLSVTYVMKEEYTITYRMQKEVIQDMDATWKKVKTANSEDAYYSKEDSRLIFKDELYHYEITSSGRELSLEEFLLMTR